MTHLWVDAGFKTGFGDWVTAALGWTVEVVTTVAGPVGFQVQPRRWVVERSIAWCSKPRRVAKDDEQQEESVEAWLELTMIGLRARRIVQLAK